MKKNIAIIPARGGSKGLPRKNVLPLGGRPMIAWPCEAALSVPELDRVICSTDNEEIAAAARQAGAEVPFTRPEALATSTAKVIDVLRHTLMWCQEQGQSYDYVVLLQATSPFVLAEDIRSALALAVEQDADTVITCVSAGRAHPAIMFSRDDDGQVKPLFPELFCGARRQDFTPFYMRVGSIYVVRAEMIMRDSRLYGDRVFSLPFPEERAVNIDDEQDYAWAEFLLSRKNSEWYA